MKTHTFKGGIHPREMKEMSNGCPIADAFPSTKSVTIPITMGGAPNSALVKVGDIVKRGQLIAKSDKFMSAPVHASISGKVKKIQSFMVTGGTEVPCITIEGDGSGETDFMPPMDPFTCTRDEALLSTVGRHWSADIEQVCLHLIPHLRQQTGNGQGIAAVIAPTGEDDNGHRRHPPSGNGMSQCFGSPLHQVNRLNGFMFYRVFIQLTYLGVCKDFHSACKDTANSSDGKTFFLFSANQAQSLQENAYLCTNKL